MAKVIKKKKKEEADVEETKTVKAGRGKKKSADAGADTKKAAPGKKGNGKKGKTTEANDLTEEFIDAINEMIEEMQNEFEKSIKNASAARRARKLSSELAKRLKEFRTVSVAHHKK